MLNVSTARRVQRVRHELMRREVVVTRVEPLGASFVAVTFGGESLAGFTSLSFDDHLKFIVDDGAGSGFKRDYTPRRFDAARRELTVEFALHGHGGASEWARRAVPGQAAVIGGPRGSMIVPTDYDWHLLAGDATALPAIRRRLEELPAGTRVTVVAELPDAADRVLPATAARLDLHWTADADGFVDRLRTLALPAGEGYVWAAGEAGTMARVRDLMLAERGHPREAARISAYWRRGVAEFHEDL